MYEEVLMRCGTLFCAHVRGQLAGWARQRERWPGVARPAHRHGQQSGHWLRPILLPRAHPQRCVCVCVCVCVCMCVRVCYAHVLVWMHAQVQHRLAIAQGSVPCLPATVPGLLLLPMPPSFTPLCSALCYGMLVRPLCGVHVMGPYNKRPLISSLCAPVCLKGLEPRRGTCPACFQPNNPPNMSLT